MFYYVLTAPFLTSVKIGVPEKMISGVMVIAQAAEILVMAFLLPYFLPKFGIRKTMLIGILAWPLRYIIFAIGAPAWLVVASLALHGFCFVFFFTAAFIYVDTIAPADIRHSRAEPYHPCDLWCRQLCWKPFRGRSSDLFHSRRCQQLDKYFPCSGGTDLHLRGGFPVVFQRGEEGVKFTSLNC